MVLDEKVSGRYEDRGRGLTLCGSLESYVKLLP